MAIDAALTHPALLGGVFASFGQVYACTARALAAAPGGAAAKCGLRLVAFHGAADRCIAASLAMRCYADLVDLGFRCPMVCVHAIPSLAMHMHMHTHVHMHMHGDLVAPRFQRAAAAHRA